MRVEGLFGIENQRLIPRVTDMLSVIYSTLR